MLCMGAPPAVGSTAMSALSAVSLRSASESGRTIGSGPVTRNRFSDPELDRSRVDKSRLVSLPTTQAPTSSVVARREHASYDAAMTTPDGADDPVRRRRASAQRLARVASRAGYLLIAAAVVTFFVALATGFNATMATIITVTLIAGCVLAGTGDHPRLRRQGRRARRPRTRHLSVTGWLLPCGSHVVPSVRQRPPPPATRVSPSPDSPATATTRHR